ncbi:GNAT family N-acetyltransferase [Jeotgalibacillus terrae]|uniref:GNAT family N-acetyltransferase n=1 Tax=Jeotgalibacillus terrae TaxID=587735 RepID=A0ABW5ZC35_9BACL|nr:GNAT family protein [Jeotgalibacillus terrae]MBM7580161.1 RimJ/RimL family protein N-acetyltransferase [Jeotgalibacillus terrae]
MDCCLVYKNIRLIPYNDDHDKNTVKWLNDEKIKSNFGLTKYVTIDSHKRWINSLKNTFIWAIYDPDTKNHCGNILLFVNYQHHSAFFQLYIGDSQSYGKKLGYYSLVCVINFAFKQLSINRIWLQVFPDNVSAISLYEKLGFKKEGIERLSHYFEGKYKDQLRYSLLEKEWEIF